jgi:Putative DNA-binding domain
LSYHPSAIGTIAMSKGRKRNITDEEIALIKAMLHRGIANDRIHFYFNRSDRLVSSGRITQIKQGKYGKDIPGASEATLDIFLDDWEKRRSPVRVASQSSRPPHHPDLIRELFEKRAKGWFLISGETDEAECKFGFGLKPQDRFADALRAIAGLANNKGGYIFFGLKDKTYELAGLRDDTFKSTDSAEFSRIITTALDPVPDYQITFLEIDDKPLGVIYVHQHHHRPVIAIKGMGKDLVEGAIYYRYVGESKAIKPGELNQIIAYREQRAVMDFARNMSAVATGDAGTVNLNTGEVKGRTGAFVIDNDLLPKIQFIREGDFSEIKGAPTLRLLGDSDPLLTPTVRPPPRLFAKTLPMTRCSEIS